MELDKETEEMMFRTIAFLQGGRFRSLTDMNQGELALLRIVMDHGNDISPGELTEKLEVSTARTANLLNSLEKKGLIERTHDNVDRRRVFVRMTEKGMKDARKKETEAHVMLHMLLDALGEEDAKTYIRIMKKISDIFENTDIPGSS